MRIDDLRLVNTKIIGAATWEEQTHDVSRSFLTSAVAFAGNTGIIVGADGVVLRTTGGGSE